MSSRNPFGARLFVCIVFGLASIAVPTLAHLDGLNVGKVVALFFMVSSYGLAFYLVGSSLDSWAGDINRRRAALEARRAEFEARERARRGGVR